MLATSISRSVSAVASEVDLFLSAKRPWNRFIRIEQRNKVNSSLQKLKKRIDVERSKLEKLVEEFSKFSLDVIFKILKKLRKWPFFEAMHLSLQRT